MCQVLFVAYRRAFTRWVSAGSTTRMNLSACILILFTEVRRAGAPLPARSGQRHAEKRCLSPGDEGRPPASSSSAGRRPSRLRTWS